MSIFQSGIPFTFLGYKTLHRPIRLLESKDNTLAGLVQSNPSLPYFNDPRGLFREGMVPSKRVSYRIYHEAEQPFVSGGEDVARSIPGFLGGASLILVAFALPEVVKSVTKTRTAVTVVEGRDIIDLPTDGLKSEDGGLVLPTNVFRAYHAGAEKLTSIDGDISKMSTLAYYSNTSDNLFRKILPSGGVANDAAKMAPGQGKRFMDALSNRISVDGSPSFVSYTSADRVLFRDVIVVRVGMTGFGIVNASTGFILTEVAAGESSFHLLRFVPYSTVDEKETKTTWRLSESYGIVPAGGVEDTPADLRDALGPEERGLAASSALARHYVYNLVTDSELVTVSQGDVSDDFDMTPLGMGMSPLLAKAKQDPASRYYDSGFRSTVFGFAPGFASIGGLLTVHSIGASDNNTAFTPAYSYTSPKLEASLSRNGRMGVEYVTSQITAVAGTAVRDTILLASTRESILGITSVYDCCAYVCNVIDSFSLSQGSTLVERFFNDDTWTRMDGTIPESSMGQFLLGEYPARSAGQLLFPGGQSAIDGVEIDGDAISVPDTDQVTFVVLSSGGNEEPAFTLHSDSEGQSDPVFEVALPGRILKDGQRVLMGIPPISFLSSRQGGGIKLSGVLGIKQGATLAEAMPANGDDKDPSGTQISLIEKQTFPLKSTSPSAAGDCAKGWSYVAFENEDRIDLGFKKFYAGNWTVVRDVTLRIPDDFDNADFKPSKDALPPSTLPYLVDDPQSETLFLFYVYKNTLLCKRLPADIIIRKNIAKNTASLTIDSEKSLISQLHGITASVVFEGDAGSESSLVIDAKKGSIKKIDQKEAAVRATRSPVQTAGDTDKAKFSNRIIQYSCCMDFSGFLFAFIQTEDALVVRSSSDMGSSWVDVVSEGFNPIPSTQGQDSRSQSDASGSNLVPEAPYCMYDWGTKNILLFFFVGQVLCYISIPSSLLRRPVDAATKALGGIRIKMLYGNLSKDLFDRGIMPAKGVSNQGESPRLNPHRITGYITATGFYRIFFKDEKERMLSLVSFNTGDSWSTEQQVVERNKKKKVQT